jgi:hypothetical protein
MHGKHKNSSQKRHNGWKTFGHESHENGDCERDCSGSIPFVHCADTDGKEHDGECNGNERDHLDKLSTVADGRGKSSTGTEYCEEYYISRANGLSFPDSPPVSAAI